MKDRRPFLFALALGALALLAVLLLWPEPEQPELVRQMPSEPASIERPFAGRTAGVPEEAEHPVDDPEAWAALDAEWEEMLADDLQCLVRGVPQGTRGVLQVGLDGFIVEVYKPELALVQSSFYLDAGSGTLSLEGFEPLNLAWEKEGDRFVCTPSTPVSAAGPFGISGMVSDEKGRPLDGVLVSGCGGAHSAR